ncbi:MAG TPA: sigma-54 dependent transcriptional regulator [Acidobacteriota bacterium]|nr:sigma-54 dependent transcriptional regulator [Acidobacteriota bacterium]
MSESGRILVVDDERNVRTTLKGVLGDEGYEVAAVGSGEDGLEELQRGDYDLVLLDIWLPAMDGLEVLERIGTTNAKCAVVMISGHGSIDAAVKSTKLGAFDFIEKPLSLDRVLLVVANAIRQQRLVHENLQLRAQVSGRVDIVGESEQLVALRRQVDRAAPSNGRVLIFGENGTGKELVARRIHALSQRHAGPFVEVNCAAIPDDLIESELFGHVKGAFTGAVATKAGKFELADGGTLFLDEVGDMSLKTQAKVLRVLEEQRFQPVGSNETLDVDVRVIAATNKDLSAAITDGSFREDLYYRLNVIPFQVPPLRARREDIPLLADRFLQDLAAEYRQQPKRLSQEAIVRLADHRWPGNVRELRNVCERAVIMAATDVITEADVATMVEAPLSASSALDQDLSLRAAREIFERRLIMAKLREFGGSVREAAAALGIERSHLYRKLKAYGIDPAETVADG